MKFQVYSNYRCPFAYRAVHWLYQLQEQGLEIEPDFRFFSLEQNNNDEEGWYVWEQPLINPNWQGSRDMRGLRAHLAAEAARQQGPDAFAKFHIALFRAIHEEHLSLSKGIATFRAAQVAELDLPAWKAECDNLAHLDTLREEHQTAVSKRIFGTPTFIFDGAQPVYVKLAALLPDDDAIPYWQDMQKMAVERPLLMEVKRP